MERAGKSLWNVLRRLADPEKPLDLLAAVWPLIVGVRLAAHTEPIAWDQGWLKVAVNEPEWQKQLESMSGEVCGQINRWWGGQVVREVSLVRGKVSPPAEPETRNPRGMAAPDLPLSENSRTPVSTILKELEGPLSEISDEELREVVARFAERYLSGRGR